MKRILLASASIVAFAGAAAAEITFSGEAALGYNDTDALSEDDEDKGFYWDAELGITFSQELDNGLVAAATVTSDVVDNQLEGDIFFGPVTVYAPCLLGRQIQQRPDGAGCAFAGAQFQPLAEKNQSCNDRSGLEIDRHLAVMAAKGTGE